MAAVESMVFFEASGGSTANPILGAAFICVSLAAITSWLGVLPTVLVW